MAESELKKIDVEEVDNPKVATDFHNIPVFTFFSPPDWSRNPVASPMVEVTEVIIHNACDLYGTITVDDGLPLQYLFKRSHDESVKTRPGDQVLLTGPDRYIWASDSVAIWLNLKDAAKTNEEVNDEELNGASGIPFISFCFFACRAEDFNSLKQEVVEGDFGSVTVKYFVFSDAVAVKFEVILLKSSEGKSVKTESEIYGKLSVHNGDSLDDGSVIFNNTLNDDDHKPICVSHGQSIPLLRSVVAVPARNKFVTLYADMSIDHTVTRWIAKFNPQPSGSSQMKLGNILVKITWI